MYIAVDTETTGGYFQAKDRPYLISTCDEYGEIKCWEFDVSPNREVLVPKGFVLDFMQYMDDHVPVFHNGKFDMQALRSVGIPVWDLWIKPLHLEDTLIASHIIRNDKPHGLKWLAENHLGVGVDDEKALTSAVIQARRKAAGWQIIKPGRKTKDDEGGSWLKMDGWLPRALYNQAPHQFPEEWATLCRNYAVKDVERTMGLWLLFSKWMQEEGWTDAYRRQIANVAPVFSLETRGVTLNLDRFKSEAARYQALEAEEIATIQAASKKPDFNPGSHPQLSKLLFEDLQAPVVKYTDKGAPSTDAASLTRLSAMLETGEYRPAPENKVRAGTILSGLGRLRKLGNTIGFLESFEELRLDDRIFPNYNQTGTDTTRFSTSRPSLNIGKGVEYEDEGEQQVEYSVRDVFGPRKGRVWLDMDYNQLQLRIFASVSKESRLIQAFQDGWDAHTFVGAQIFGTDKLSKFQRRVAKAINFGFIFGAGPEKLTAVSGDPKIWDMVNKLFPNAVAFLDETSAFVRKNKYVEFAGQRLYIPPSKKTGKDRPYAGVCYIVQGLEGLIAKYAMQRWCRYLRRLGEEHKDPNFGYLTMMLHDQLVADVRDVPLRWLKRIGQHLRVYMEDSGRAFGVETPVSVAVIRDSWANGEEVDW